VMPPNDAACRGRAVDVVVPWLTEALVIRFRVELLVGEGGVVAGVVQRHAVEGETDAGTVETTENGC